MMAVRVIWLKFSLGGIDVPGLEEKMRGHRVSRLQLCELDRAVDVYSWLLDRNNNTASAETLNRIAAAYGMERVVKPDEVAAAQPSGGMAWDKGRFFQVLFAVTDDIGKRADRLADEIGLAEPGSYSALHLRLGKGVGEAGAR